MAEVKVIRRRSREEKAEALVAETIRDRDNVKAWERLLKQAQRSLKRVEKEWGKAMDDGNIISTHQLKDVADIYISLERLRPTTD